MSVITGAVETRQVYAEAAEKGVCLGAFCFEDAPTLEAILEGARRKGEELGAPDVPIVASMTANYPPRGQAKLYTAAGDAKLGLRMALDDMHAFATSARYSKLRVLTHLDHGFPWLDRHGLYETADRFSSVMFDASERPLDENIRMTAEYVREFKDRVVIEACVDEIIEAGSGAEKDVLTDARVAERFAEETGADLLVCNLGTEHRSTAVTRRFHAGRAREISARTGSRLVLHGTSSLSDSELSSLAACGIVRVNVYTVLAKLGGQAEAGWWFENFGGVLDREQVIELVERGRLGRWYLSEEHERLCGGRVGPRLEKVARPERRDAWFEAVASRVKAYLNLLGYDNYARGGPG